MHPTSTSLLHPCLGSPIRLLLGQSNGSAMDHGFSRDFSFGMYIFYLAFLCFSYLQQQTGAEKQWLNEAHWEMSIELLRSATNFPRCSGDFRWQICSDFQVFQRFSTLDLGLGDEKLLFRAKVSQTPPKLQRIEVEASKWIRRKIWMFFLFWFR